MTIVDFARAPFDGALLRSAFGSFPSGVTAVCALVEGRPVGMAASSFTSVSLDPPLVAVCAQTSSSTWQLLRAAPSVCVSVLSGDHGAACRALAGPADDRFTDVAWDHAPSGAPRIADAAAWFDCTLDAELPAGDHVIGLLRIQALAADAERTPLVFHRSAFVAIP